MTRRRDKLKGAAHLARANHLHLGHLPLALELRYPERELAVGPSLLGKERWTGSDIHRICQQLAAVFRGAGVRKGKLTLVATANRLDLLFITLAVAAAGGIPAPISHHVKPGELDALIQATGAEAAVCDDKLAAPLRRALGNAQILVADTRTPTTGRSLLTLLDSDPEPLPKQPLADPNEVALYLCTSGTTGLPKAAALTSTGLLGALRLLSLIPLGKSGRGLRAGRDAVFTALPLAHVMGLAAAFGALFTGVRWVHQERFNAAEALQLLQDERINCFLGVPTMYADLEAAGAADADLSHVQLWLSGADAMPLDRARRFQSYGAMMRLGGRPIGVAAFGDLYGMVELSGPAAVRVLPPAITLAASLQLPHKTLPEVHIRVVDDEGKTLRWGRDGRLQVRGPGVLQHYKNHDKAGPDAEGWFDTGDFARTYPGGLFQFSGRHRDRLKISGFSVFPAEVEAQLDGFPGVAEVCIVGVPDDRTGERIVALTVGEPVEEASFLEWSKSRVLGYRRPTQVLQVDAIPRGKHDKIDRKAATVLAIEQLSA